MAKILIVDDSMIMRNIHKNAMKEHGIDEDRFIESGDGEEALALLIRNDVDIIILDWNMPKLDGLEFVTKVRAIEKYKDTPIIMVTSEAARENVLIAIKAGVTNYVVKPITGEKLWAKFEEYLI